MKKRLFFLVLAAGASLIVSAQGSWVQKANFGGFQKQQATGFSIGNYGYLGLGYEAFSYPVDLWQYDPSSNTWMQKANCPCGSRWATVGFSIGNKGYVSTGFTSNVSNTFYTDLWCYDPSSNSWSQKANFPGGARWYAVGFSIGGKGYVGLGYDGSVPVYYNDLWEYDPASDTWTAKAAFPGTGTNLSTAFSIGGKGYVLGGSIPYSSSCSSNLWEFDPVANTWMMKTAYPGMPCVDMVSFSVGSFGYAGLGKDVYGNLDPDFYQYDPVTDTWSTITFFTGIKRHSSVAFSIGSKGYVSTGNDGTPSPGGDLKDLWEFTPLWTGIEEGKPAFRSSVKPNPGTGIFTITSPTEDAVIEIRNILGEQIYRDDKAGFSRAVDISQQPKGIYILRLTDSRQQTVIHKIVID